MHNWQHKIKDILSRGITQAELAELLGVTQGYISHLLTGRRKKVSYDIGEKLNALHKSTKTPSGN